MGNLQHGQHVGLQRAVGEVKPVQVFDIVLMRRRQCEPSVAMDVDDVFCACGGFGKCEASILDYGGLAQGIEVFDGLGGEDWCSLVENEIIGDLQFFTEPDDALGLTDLEVVDGEGHFVVVTVHVVNFVSYAAMLVPS